MFLASENVKELSLLCDKGLKPKGIFVRLSLLLLFPCFSGDSTLLECYGLSTTAFKIGFWGSISGYSGSIS